MATNQKRFVEVEDSLQEANWGWGGPMASKAKPRIKSAHPRFAGPSPEPEEAEPSGGGRTGSAARRRVQSAKERKQSHDASEVFPVANDLTSPSQVGMRWKTSYKADFQSRQGTRSEPRPTSATRRNNPHPNQAFSSRRRQLFDFIIIMFK